MYFDSYDLALGSTSNFCTTHGYSEPISRLLTISSAVPTTGRRQRPMIAVTMKSTATTAAMPARIARPGIVALTSV